MLPSSSGLKFLVPGTGFVIMASYEKVFMESKEGGKERNQVQANRKK
jgi:hypothetical protein